MRTFLASSNIAVGLRFRLVLQVYEDYADTQCYRSDLSRPPF
jgi:hypothetical protein